MHPQQIVNFVRWCFLCSSSFCVFCKRLEPFFPTFSALLLVGAHCTDVLLSELFSLPLFGEIPSTCFSVSWFIVCSACLASLASACAPLQTVFLFVSTLWLSILALLLVPVLHLILDFVCHGLPQVIHFLPCVSSLRHIFFLLLNLLSAALLLSHVCEPPRCWWLCSSSSLLPPSLGGETRSQPARQNREGDEDNISCAFVV